MKFLLLLSISLFSHLTFSQLKKGFDPLEAKEMIAICNSYTYLELTGDDSQIIPRGYRRIYTSPSLGMDNKFQVYRKGRVGIINFRGSTDKKSSWLENIYSPMIPIEGEIKMPNQTFAYKFGEDTAANVHSGFSLGLAYLHSELLDQIKSLNDEGIYDILLTGHSQGGSLALLSMAYLEHANNRKVAKQNKFKVYTFAQPMVGNIEFIREYNAKFCTPEMSFSMINPDDIVPRMPMSYNDSTFVRDNLITALFSRDNFDSNNFLKDGLMLLFEDKLKGFSTKIGTSIDEQIKKELGDIEIPKSTGRINYAQVGNLMLLPPPDYPLELKDSSILSNKEFLAENKRDADGVFYRKSVYKKTSVSNNHKPYNYYTAVLKVYFPKEYEAIEPKSFGL